MPYEPVNFGSPRSCPQCGMQVSWSAEVCPHCGKTDLSGNEAIVTFLFSMAWLIILSIAWVGLLLVRLVMALFRGVWTLVGDKNKRTVSNVAQEAPDNRPSFTCCNCKQPFTEANYGDLENSGVICPHCGTTNTSVICPQCGTTNTSTLGGTFNCWNCNQLCVTSDDDSISLE